MIAKNILASVATTLVLALTIQNVNANVEYDVNRYCQLVPSGTRMPSFKSCQNYHTCNANGNSTEESCTSTQSFDRQTQSCRPSSLVECFFGVDNPCANRNKEFVPIIGECQGWIYCENNAERGRGRCGTGQIFDASISECIHGTCSDSGDTESDFAVVNNVCEIMQSGQFFGSFDDCQTWQRCNNLVLGGGTCNTGLVYNTQRRMCLADDGTMCERTDNTAPVTPTETCTAAQENHLTPDTNICSIFYECDGTTWQRQNCANGQFYDVRAEECRNRQIATPVDSCNRCQFATTANWVNAVDPNCRKFQTCQDGVVIGNGECAVKQFFNEQRQACVVGGTTFNDYINNNGACAAALPSCGDYGSDNCPSDCYVDGSNCVDICPTYIDGSNCVATCPKLTDGVNCVETCEEISTQDSCNANSAECSFDSGTCVTAVLACADNTFDNCPAGCYVDGSNCVDACPELTDGANCVNTCEEISTQDSCNANSAKCSFESGTCVTAVLACADNTFDNCPAGCYVDGSNCVDACPELTDGANCVNTCEEISTQDSCNANSAKCSFESGTCVTAVLACADNTFDNCPAGCYVDGSNCVDACPELTDGANCVETCEEISTQDSCNANSAKCAFESGTCVTAVLACADNTFDNCPAGCYVDGSNCVDACPTYIDGSECVDTCPTYVDGSNCVDTCPTYIDGSECVDTCPTYIDGSECVDTCPTYVDGVNCVDTCPNYIDDSECVDTFDCTSLTDETSCVAAQCTFDDPDCVN